MITWWCHPYKSNNDFFYRLIVAVFICLLVAILCTITTCTLTMHASRPPTVPTPVSLNTQFAHASQEFSVPDPLLKAICYLEGNLSNHDGQPSSDGGYGCMHLVQNSHANTLQQAAHELHVSPQQLKIDMGTNIRGGAVILRDMALQVSPDHTLPASLAGWYGAIAMYSQAVTPQPRFLFADAIYHL